MSKLLYAYFFKKNLTAFRAAILANNTNRICHILDFERSYISKQLDDSGNTALLVAVKFASPLTVQLLLQQGAYPDQPNFLTFRTPLSFLASIVFDVDQVHQAKLALEMATLLLDNDAYVDKLSPFEFVDEHGKEYVMKETPLMTAVRTKNLAMATLFVERKANVNYMEKQFEKRSVHLSILNGDEAMFDLLEDAGASCRTVATTGENTLLHWFCYNKANDRQTSLLKKLIDVGCDVNAENNHQYTPLMLAAKLNMINTCKILIDAYADIEKVDNKGFRAIDLAKLGGQCFKLLQKASNIPQKKSQSYQNIDRIIGKRQTILQRAVSMQVNKQADFHLKTQEHELKHCPSNTICKEKKLKSENNLSYGSSDHEEENDRKYKRMWDKLLHKKPKIRRTKYLSMQAINSLY